MPKKDKARTAAEELNRQDPLIARNLVVDDNPLVLKGLFRPEAVKKISHKEEVSLEEFLDSMKDEYKRTV